MNICGAEVVLHGTALVTLADTLAAHQLGGFKVGVGFSLRKCRNCMATLEQMSTKVSTYYALKERVNIYLQLASGT